MSTTQVALALWGLCGAFIYSASRLITAVLGEQEITRRDHQRAWAQFLIALVFGPAAAVAFAPMIAAKLGAHSTTPAVALAVGLSVNSAWPVFMEILAPSFKRATRVLVAEINSKLNGAP